MGVFLAGAVASALIGAALSPDTFVAAKNAVVGGGDEERSVNVLPSQMVSATRIGLFNIEENGRFDAALFAFGDPTNRRRDDVERSCTVEWGPAGVEGEFYTLGGGDPCVEGDFCRATVSGRQFATDRGLQVADTVTRLHDLYGDAIEAKRPGAVEYWVLDRGANLCGRDPLGGLVAGTFNGRVTSFEVNFHAGGE